MVGVVRCGVVRCGMYSALLGIGLVDWYVGKEVDGLFAVCQSSEMLEVSVSTVAVLLEWIIMLCRSGILCVCVCVCVCVHAYIRT